MENLLALQRLEFGTSAPTAANRAKMSQLRGQVPAQVLLHYQRFGSRGKRGVSTVRNGVCGECHLQIPGGKLAGLASSTEIQRCDNCGRYLFVPETMSTGTTDPTPLPPTKTRRTKKTIPVV